MSDQLQLWRSLLYDVEDILITAGYFAAHKTLPTMERMTTKQVIVNDKTRHSFKLLLYEAPIASAGGGW